MHTQRNFFQLAFEENAVEIHPKDDNLEVTAHNVSSRTSSSFDPCDDTKFSHCWQYNFNPGDYDYRIDHPDGSYYDPLNPLPEINYNTCTILSRAKKGDIIYEDTPGKNPFGHSAIVTGKVTFEHNGKSYTYLEVVEAVHDDDGGVTRSMIDCTRFEEKRGYLYRVPSASQSQINTVIAKIETQLDKEYAILSLQCNWSGDYWYCSELVYCGYKHVGITIANEKTVLKILNMFGSPYWDFMELALDELIILPKEIAHHSRTRLMYDHTGYVYSTPPVFPPPDFCSGTSICITPTSLVKTRYYFVIPKELK